MRQSIAFGIAVFLVSLGLAACQASGGGGPSTWLDAPLDGMEFEVQEPVTIMAHASDLSGVTRFEFYADDKLIAVDAGSGGRLGKGDAGWVPPAAGVYYIHARATNSAGSVGSDAISRIVVHDPQQVLACCPLPRLSTDTPTPTVSPMATPSITPITVTPPPPAPPPSSCAFDAGFVDDVTVPPGTALAPNQPFNKIWRVRNLGSCAWDASVRLDYVGGEMLTAQQEIVVPATAPGATADLLVAMTTPNVPGLHYTQWRMRNSQQWFGPGLEVWLNAVSSQPAPPPPQPNVCPGPPAIALFTTSDATINAGQTATLSWGAVSNATSASIDPDIGGVPTPGSVSVRPNQTTTYTLTASGCGGTVRRQVRIVVNQAPAPPPPLVCPGPPVIASFTADAYTITQGQSTTLRWGAVSNATSVTIDPDIGGVTTSGFRVIAPRATTTYALTASGCGGTVRRQVTITVNAVPPPPPPPPPADTTPPSISNPQFTTRSIPKKGCGGGQVTVTATATDPSGVASVVARLSGTPQTGDVSMSPVGGNLYLANLGPFVTPGDLTIYIVARDNRGNTGQSGPYYVTVTDCKIQ